MEYKNYSDDKVIVNIPKTKGKTGNLWISVNGVDIEIPRGIDTLVEKKYLEVIERYLRAEQKEEESIESIKKKERERIGAASQKDVEQLSRDIADLKENGNGVTKEQADSLWAVLQKSAFAEQLTSAELVAFKAAWGIDVVVVPATAVTLTPTSLSFATLNDSQTLKATLVPSDSTDSIVWSTSNDKVVKVVKGVVTPVGNGMATITATATSGVKATCSVNIALDANVYTVTNTLTNVTTSNNVATVEEGTTYIANLTVADGYNMESVTVTMGGVDITATAYANGTISITSVTGDIVIEAIATEINNVIYELAQPLVCDGVNYEDTGVVVCGTGNLYSKNFTIVTEFEVDVFKVYAINGDGKFPDFSTMAIYSIANANRFSLLYYTPLIIRKFVSNAGCSIELDVGSYNYNTLKNDTVKVAITHIAGENAVKLFGISENKGALKEQYIAGVYSNLNQNVPYTLVLGAYYDADTNGNIVPSNFRGTIKSFTIYEEILTDEVIHEFLGVE